MADGLRIRVESYFGSSRLPASRARRGAHSPPHPQHMHTHSSPPSRAPPSVFSRTIPSTHIFECPSVHNTPAGGRDGAFRERESRRDGRTFPVAPPSLSDSPLDVYSPPQALQGGGREEHHHRSSSTPLSPCLAFFLLPSHRSKRFHSKQQDSAPSSFHITHPLKPGYNRQTPQQRPFCGAAVGDAGSVLHRGGREGPSPPE